MVRIAFYDAPILVTSLNAVKDYILVGDVHQGVQFMRSVACWLLLLSVVGVVGCWCKGGWRHMLVGDVHQGVQFMR